MNNTMMQPEELGKILSPIPYIQKMQAGDKSMIGVYVLHFEHGQVERVAASTASEAIRKSTYGTPVRVTRFDPLSQVLISGEDFNFTSAEESAEDHSAKEEGAPLIDAVAAQAQSAETESASAPAEPEAAIADDSSAQSPPADAPPAG